MDPIADCEWHRPSGQLPYPQLGALQIGQDADRPAHLLLDGPNDVVTRPVLVVAAVAEIEPEYIGSSLANARIISPATGPNVATIFARTLLLHDCHSDAH